MKNKENNKIIAEFMGFVYPSKNALKGNDRLGIIMDNEFCNLLFGEDSDEWVDESEILFDKSWDWLMPVVEKIEKLGVSTDIYYYAGTTKNASGFHGIELLGYSADLSIYDSKNQYDTKLESVYKAVVKFINLYNKQS